jgi:hypothetical protein
MDYKGHPINDIKVVGSAEDMVGNEGKVDGPETAGGDWWHNNSVGWADSNRNHRSEGKVRSINLHGQCKCQ